VKTIQFPYVGKTSASWYNREESYLEQLKFNFGCSFLIVQNRILHL